MSRKNICVWVIFPTHEVKLFYNPNANGSFDIFNAGDDAFVNFLLGYINKSICIIVL